MEGIGQSIGAAILFCILVVALLIGSGAWLSSRWVYKKDYIETRARITPTFKLTTDGVKVDTVFIYKIPKQQ